MKKLIQFIDFMGQKPKLLINKSNKFKTVEGGILSCMLFILTMIGVIYFGQEIYHKRLPLLIFSKEYDDDPEQFNMTNYKFSMMFGIANSSQYYFDKSVYNLTMIVHTETYEDNMITIAVVPIQLDTFQIL